MNKTTHPIIYGYLQLLSYALKTQKGTRYAPTQNPSGVAGAGRGRRSHPTAQHHIAARRPDPPCPSQRSVALGLLPLASPPEAAQSSSPPGLPIQQAALSTFAVQQTRQPQSDGELSTMQTRPDSATDHQPSVEFAVNRP